MRELHRLDATTLGPAARAEGTPTNVALKKTARAATAGRNIL
jgi:hypothetical protein